MKKFKVGDLVKMSDMINGEYLDTYYGIILDNNEYDILYKVYMIYYGSWPYKTDLWNEELMEKLI